MNYIELRILEISILKWTINQSIIKIVYLLLKIKRNLLNRIFEDTDVLFGYAYLFANFTSLN